MSSAMDDEFKRFELIQQDMHHEGTLFWTRFTGFTTLHAGLFVIATSTDVQTRFIASVLVAAFGTTLAIIWIGIHVAGKGYVDGLKPLYQQAKIQALKLEDDPADRIDHWWMHSTKLSGMVPTIVLAIWVILLIISFSRQIN